MQLGEPPGSNVDNQEHEWCEDQQGFDDRVKTVAKLKISPTKKKMNAMPNK